MKKLILIMAALFVAKPAEAITPQQQIEHTTKDIDCLAKNIYYEARGESDKGKYAVAQVVINRMKSNKYPKKVCQVIYQKGQFSWTKTKNAMPKGEAWAKSLEIAKHILSGYREISIKDALFFHHVNVRPRWRGTRVAVIGKHAFYA